MYLSNWHSNYGHLINGDEYDTSHLHNDMYSLFQNNMVCSLLVQTCLFVGLNGKLVNNNCHITCVYLMW